MESKESLGVCEYVLYRKVRYPLDLTAVYQDIASTTAYLFQLLGFEEGCESSLMYVCVFVCARVAA